MKRNVRYWLCQIIGWGSWNSLILFLTYRFSREIFFNTIEKRNLYLYETLVDFVCFILFTHLLRLVLRKIKWITFPSSKVFITFLVSVIVTSLCIVYANKIFSNIPKVSFAEYIKNEQKEKAIALEKDMQLTNTDYYLYEVNGKLDSAKYASFQKIKISTNWYKNSKKEWVHEDSNGGTFGAILFACILVSLWLLIYIGLHYIEKNRRDQIDKLRLEAVVKSLELKTIKSHINPHFIFNALNSIRALVDENPTRARTAITELSNILRSSLQAEKLETVPLEQEIDIVQDYLALEHMRFEERLKIEMHIDPDTLVQPIPPMMLQNLVENAIKHGISKDVNGGIIIIKSYFKDNHHELIVQNTGNLSEIKTGTNAGFGLKSTQDRLNLLYQKKAQFEIAEIKGNMVQSKIIMPVLVTI
jgi:two-component system, LytTR family, sensor kinase